MRQLLAHGRAAAALGAAALLLAASPGASAARRPRCANRTVQVTAGSAVWVSLRCAAERRARIVVEDEPGRGTLARVDQRRDRVRYRAPAAFAGTDRFRVAYVRGKRRVTATVTVRVIARVASPPAAPVPAPPPLHPPAAAAPSTPLSPPTPPGPAGGGDLTIPYPPPVCEGVNAMANYMKPVAVAITCTGEGMAPLRIAAGPASGTLSDVRTFGTPARQTLTATYTPNAQFVGLDRIVVDAAGGSGVRQGSIDVNVRPWRMRAIGDSVTAGFGYYGDGSLMSVDDLLSCKPAAVVSNRCSSNSDERGGYAGPPEWSADFGLRDDVSWAAQFANTWQGGGHITAPEMFQNRAVTGSAPSDWLPKGGFNDHAGILNDELNRIVAEDPDLVVMTMGANPLLSDLLLTTAGEECSLKTTVATLRGCLKPFFDNVHLTDNLQRLYTALLQAPDTQVITFQYHLAVPSANLFDAWQLEQMIGYFNEEITDAVNATKAALPPAQADRLTMIVAQTDPTDADPLKLPRFDLGLGPQDFDTWTPAYDCGFDDEVDGQSHQSTPTQDEWRLDDTLFFCPGTPWIIGADTGIHPSKAGYTQFAGALTNVVSAKNLIPPLP